MTNQEALDKSAKHLLDQGRKSFPAFGYEHSSIHHTFYNCAYRGEDGAMCAIGCLFPDEEYSPNMEGLGINSLIRENLLPPSLHGMDRCFLQDLQFVHDNRPVKEWRMHLESVAHRWGLQINF